MGTAKRIEQIKSKLGADREHYESRSLWCGVGCPTDGLRFRRGEPGKNHLQKKGLCAQATYGRPCAAGGSGAVAYLYPDLGQFSAHRRVN